MKTMKLKAENELTSRLASLESFGLTNEEMVKLFGGSEPGTATGNVPPPPIVKDNGDE